MSTTTGEFSTYLVLPFSPFFSSCGLTIQLYTFTHSWCSCLKLYLCRLVLRCICHPWGVCTQTWFYWHHAWLIWCHVRDSLRLVISILLSWQVPLSISETLGSHLSSILIPNWALCEHVLSMRWYVQVHFIFVLHILCAGVHGTCGMLLLFHLTFDLINQNIKYLCGCLPAMPGEIYFAIILYVRLWSDLLIIRSLFPTKAL